MVERSLGVRKVVGSNPSRAIPKFVNKWHLKGECCEIWLVGPVSAYNVTGWGAPVKCLRQQRSSVAALLLVSCRYRRNMTEIMLKEMLNPSTKKLTKKLQA